MKQSIYVFGTGFLGKNYIDYFIDHNFLVHSFSRSSNVHRLHPNLIHQKVDLINDEFNIEHVASLKAIIYVVSTTVAGIVNHEETIQDEIFALRKVLHLLKNHPNSKFFLISSASVYGVSNGSSFSEMDACKPTSMYALMKKRLEEVLMQHTTTNQSSYYIFRVSNLFGPYQFRQGIVAKVLNAHKFKQPIIVFNKGQTIRDFLFVEDLLYLTLLFIDGDIECGIYNISSGKGVSVNSIIDYISSIYPIHNNLVVYHDTEEPNPFNVLNNSKVKTIFPNWSVTPLNNSLTRTIQWWFKHN